MVAGGARPRAGRCCDCAYWSDARADGVPDAYGACGRDADAPCATRADSEHAWEECWVPLPDGRGRDFAVRPAPLRGGGR